MTIDTPYSVSIIICTDGRATALKNTLASLAFLGGPDFEVCVVRGPTNDDVDEVLQAWNGSIKSTCNPIRNLSVSRNIGIQMSSGDLIAFIDDDAIPEPEWLQQIVQSFDDPKVGGAGGIVMDHTGVKPQYLYATANRLGIADTERQTPAQEYNFPQSYNFPYVQGTNSIFRRSALQDIGGFDEEFDFYLDETDLCCRLIDAGWRIEQRPNAIVHHKFLPSNIRNNARVTRALYQVIKNKLYFSIINNHGHYLLTNSICDMNQFVDNHRNYLKHHMALGNVNSSDLSQYELDVERAWEVGLRRGLSGIRRLAPPVNFLTSAFLIFRKKPIKKLSESLVFVINHSIEDTDLSKKVPDTLRYAKEGHKVHIISPDLDLDHSDFVQELWHHRLLWDGENFFESSPVKEFIHNLNIRENIVLISYLKF